MSMGSPERVFGIVLIALGAVLVLVSLVIGPSGISTSGAVVVLIGPVPISLGFGPQGTEDVVVALSLSLVVMLIWLVMFFAARRSLKWG